MLESMKKELMQWREETEDPFLDEDYTARFTDHYFNHQNKVREWEKANPNKSVWKTPLINADWIYLYK